MGTTIIRRHIAAPRARVFAALLDPAAVARWKAPDDMTVTMHEFDARVGGRIRVSLTYQDPARAGKSELHTDTYRGRFVEIVPGERVVEEDEFETADPMLAGTMTSTITLTDAEGGTTLVAEHAGLPPGLNPEDNETGWRMSLGKLAALVEAGPP